MLKSFTLLAQQPSPYKYFVYIGASASLWYKSEQPKMENRLRPLHIYFNIGKHQGWLSLRTDMTISQGFKQDFVLLNSYFAGLSLEVNTRKIWPRLGVFLYSGPNVWYSTLRFEGTNYEEQDKGFGFDVGSGIYYRFLPNMKLNLSFLFQSSARGAWFYAGRVYKQNVGVGSFQALVSVSYNLF